MYDFFDGEVIEKGPAHVVLHLNGVGYHFSVSLETSEKIQVHDSVRLFSHLHVRENEHRLFGFHAREERALFQLLLTVSGVGPSLAIKLLSGCSQQPAFHALRGVDVAAAISPPPRRRGGAFEGNP